MLDFDGIEMLPCHCKWSSSSFSVVYIVYPHTFSAHPKQPIKSLHSAWRRQSTRRVSSRRFKTQFNFYFWIRVLENCKKMRLFGVIALCISTLVLAEDKKGPLVTDKVKFSFFRENLWTYFLK